MELLHPAIQVKSCASSKAACFHSVAVPVLELVALYLELSPAAS